MSNKDKKYMYCQTTKNPIRRPQHSFQIKFHQVFISVTFVFLLITAGQLALAEPFSYVHQTTVFNSNHPNVNIGDTLRIIVTLDNGGTTNASQTWTADDHLQSVTFEVSNGGVTSLVTMFSAPFDGGLAFSTGSFVTDADGVLTAVMTNWQDTNITQDFTTNSSQSPLTPLNWYINGANAVYTENGLNAFIDINDVGNNNNAAFWSLLGGSTPPSSVGGFAEPLFPAGQ